MNSLFGIWSLSFGFMRIEGMNPKYIDLGCLIQPFCLEKFKVVQKFLFVLIMMSYFHQIYLFKVNNARTICKIYSKLTITTTKLRYRSRYGVFIVNFEHISHVVLVFSQLNKCHLVRLTKFTAFFFSRHSLKNSMKWFEQITGGIVQRKI